MHTLGLSLSILVALEHFGFMILEMFFWTKPLGLKIFRLSEANAQASATLAMNQGLYNGFLAAGLVWSVVQNNRANSLFFLGCVVVAGLFGGMTVKRSILFVQALPALFACAAIWFFL